MIRKIRKGAAAVLFLTGWLLPMALPAENRVSNTVTGVTYSNLTDAVAALTEDGQTLMVSPGVYTEPGEIVFQYAVTVQGGDAETTVIQAAASPGIAAGRIFSVNIAVEYGVALPVVLDGLTLRHGHTDGSGGAVYVQEGTLTVRNCIISDNRAGGDGGGLAALSSEDAALNVEDSVLSGNIAGRHGGGMMRGTALRTSFTGNIANGSGGGAAYADLDQCALTENQAQQGGGLFSGRAIRCIIHNNQAVFGGGAYETAVSGSLLTGNSAGQTGGGLHGGAATNCTVAANSAQTSGGGLQEGTAINTIFYGNQAPAGADISENSVLSYSRSNPVAPGEGNIHSDPRFRNAAAGNYAIHSSSPCVDAGLSSAAPAGPDLAGNARIQGAAVDMGAYEKDPSEIDYAGFEEWLERHGLPIDAAGQFTLDHNGDGIANGLEFAFGTNRVNGGLLTVIWTGQGAVAETAVQTEESVGYVELSVKTTGNLSDPSGWVNAVPVAEGAPPGAARFRRDAQDGDRKGFFRLYGTLLSP